MWWGRVVLRCVDSLRGAGVVDVVEGVLVLFCVGIFRVRCGMKSRGGPAFRES